MLKHLISAEVSEYALKHSPQVIDINDSIDVFVQGLVGAAPAAPPNGPGGAAVVGQLPTDWITQVWNYVDTSFGQKYMKNVYRRFLVPSRSQ